MQGCKRASEKRNALVHGLYAKDEGGEPVISGPGWQWTDLPKMEELRALSSELESLVAEINRERFHGFLDEALRSRTPK